MVAQMDSHETQFYLKLFVKSSFFIFAAVIISKLFSYGYKIIIARSFGAETYGLFSLAIIIITIASSIATFGLYDGLVRFVSFYRGKRAFGHIRRLVLSSQAIFIVTGLICTALLIFFAPVIGDKIFHTDKFTPLFIGMALALPFLLLANLFLGVLRGFERIKTYSALINIYQNTAKFIILGLLVLLGAGAISISISYVVVFIGLFLISRYYARKDLNKMPLTKIPSRKEVMPEVLSYAWPLLFVGVLYSIFYWTDSLVLGYFTTAEHVGWYNAAITLISLFGIAPDLFMQLFFPLISLKLSEDKKSLIKRLTQQVTKWIYILNIPIFLLLFLFPEKLLEILFGRDFTVGSSVLQILALGALFSSVMGVSTSLLSIKGRTKLVLMNFILFATINLILDIIFVKSYGMIGAAFATMITQILFVVTAVFQVRNTYEFSPIKSKIGRLSFLAVALLAVGLFLQSTFANNSLATIIGVSLILLALYALGLHMFQIFDTEDKSIIQSIVNKLSRRNNA